MICAHFLKQNSIFLVNLIKQEPMSVDELLKHIDIVDYIGQFVELEERNGEFWGLSPFTGEKTPSFSIRRESNKFYDFSSGFGGSLITFVQRYFHVNSSDAIKKLADYAGLDDKQLRSIGDLSATSICKRFAARKPSEKQCVAAQLDDNCMEKYEKRADKLAVWEKEGISVSSMERFQVRYDPLYDRIVYPVRDLNGKIVNIGGRTLDPAWKEKKLSKYCYYYPWGTIKTIYGITENREKCEQNHEIIIFEGVKSVLLADTWGIQNTGAILTSHLSVAQLKILAKLGYKVVFALDNDVDILKDHNISRLSQFVSVYYIKDTGNLIGLKDSPVDKGKDVFLKLYEQRVKYRSEVV